MQIKCLLSSFRQELPTTVFFKKFNFCSLTSLTVLSATLLWLCRVPGVNTDVHLWKTSICHFKNDLKLRTSLFPQWHGSWDKKHISIIHLNYINIESKVLLSVISPFDGLKQKHKNNKPLIWIKISLAMSEEPKAALILKIM